MRKFLKIEWWNDHDLGDVVYQSGFRNIIYLDVEVDEPEYQTTIESDLNGDNQEITKFRKWEKVYHFKLWGTEDLTDAFTFMQVHDNIEVTLQTGQLIEVEKHRLRAEVKWEPIGCLAEIDVTFAENYVVAGNCDENKSTACACEDPDPFWEVIDYADINSTSPGSVPIVLAYTVEDIAGKKLTAEIYEYAGGWVKRTSEAGDCWRDIATGNKWVFDGQFWYLFPGFIVSLTEIGSDIEIVGGVIPSTFGAIYYTKDGSLPALIGIYTEDELVAGVLWPHTGAGTYDFYMNVYNHSCAYVNTDSEQIILT